jgi:hypothetical protein
MSLAVGREASQHFPVDQKAGFLCDLVVQLHGRFICLVRLPIHPVAAGPSCVSIDLLDQRAPYSLPKRRDHVRFVISSGKAVLSLPP